MRTKGRRNGLLGAGLAVTLMAAMWVGSSWAATIVVDGIKVTYPYAFDAYYDSSDGTLTIQIFEEGGSLSVKALNWAPNYWGGVCGCLCLGQLLVCPLYELQGPMELSALHRRPGRPYRKVDHQERFCGWHGLLWDSGLGTGLRLYPFKHKYKERLCLRFGTGGAVFDMPMIWQG